MTLAIINLIAVIVAGLEGPGGELLRELTELGKKSANGEPLTPEQLAWFDQQREAAAARLGASIDAKLGDRSRGI